MTTGDEAAVTSAAAAAVAAVASWAAVAQNARTQRRTLEPRLNIQVAQDLAPGRRQNLVTVHVENTGGGFASEVYFWVREGSAVCMSGLPPTASLGPGKSVTLATQLFADRGQSSAEALVLWRFGARTYAQAGAPSHRKTWSRRKWAFWAPKSNEEIVERFFPAAGPARSWRLVSYEVVD